MAGTKARPTRAPEEAAPAADATPDNNGDAPAAPKQRKPRQRKPAAPKLRVYHDGEDTLSLVGEYAGHKPEEALQSYFNALDPETLPQAIEAATYAVDTPKGLIRLAVTQTISISRR